MLVGTVAGTIAGYALSGLLRGALAGVDGPNVSVFLVSAAVLFLCGLASCVLPVRHALSADPIEMLKEG